MAVLHQKRVPVVHRVAELKGVHGIGTHLLELRTKLKRSESEPVESIVPHDAVENLVVVVVVVVVVVECC